MGPSLGVVPAPSPFKQPAQEEAAEQELNANPAERASGLSKNANSIQNGMGKTNFEVCRAKAGFYGQPRSRS